MSVELIVLIVVLVALSDLVILPPILLNPERKRLDQHIRSKMPELSFARLSDGTTHYSLQGPEGAPVVVFVHGATTPFVLAWRYNHGALLDAGFRVLQYDLFGRGLSDRPERNNNADFFDRQLLELLNHLGLHEPVDIVGLSMGGGITVNFVDRHPERVRRFALIAPWLLADTEPPNPVFKLLTTPLLGEWLLAVLGKKFLIRGVEKMLPNREDIWPDVKSVYNEQMSYKGFRFSVLSSLREYPCRGMAQILPRIAARGRRAAVLIWGDADNVAPFNPFHDRTLQLLPWLEDHVIPGGDHLINFVNAEQVNPILVELFTRSEAE